LRDAVEDVRALAGGRLPATLVDEGLRPALADLVRPLATVIELEVPDTRFAPEVEAVSYFVVGEAISNAIKHGWADSDRLDEDAATFAEGVLAARLRTTAFPEPVCGTSPASASFVGHNPQCEGPTVASLVGASGERSPKSEQALAFGACPGGRQVPRHLGTHVRRVLTPGIRPGGVLAAKPKLRRL
jgi:hypothetical protein